MRRLAAIMATDVAGYSRMMAADEAGTLAALSEIRRGIVEPEVARCNGRIVKLMGDGALIEFASAVNAADCALAVQRRLADADTDVTLRIGINLGDVAVEDDDIFGDGVNVAARLQALAEPGTVLISEKVHSEVAGRPEFGAVALGARQLRNMDGTVSVWQLVDGGGAAAASAGRRRWSGLAMAGGAALAVAIAAAVYLAEPFSPAGPPAQAARQNLPAIAVLPFANMSGDAGQDYFSDGITVDLVTDLSGVSGLFVIAWNSSSRIDDGADVRTAAAELGADYILDGSVRRAGDSVRINAELFEGESGRNLWADRFDREITDVFAVQDDVVRQIVAALRVELTAEEETRLDSAEPVDPEIYDMMLRARAELTIFSPEGDRTARELLREVVRRDPDNAHAWASIGMGLAQRVIRAWDSDPGTSMARGLEVTERAVTLDPKLPWAWLARSIMLMAAGRLEDSEAAVRKAIELDANYADAYAQLGANSAYAGRGEQGLEAVEIATRLNPARPWQYSYTAAMNAFILGRDEQAVDLLTESIERNTEFLSNHVFLAASYAHLGRQDDAEWEVEEILLLNPDYSIATIRESMPFARPEDRDRLVEGLRTAGLPES